MHKVLHHGNMDMADVSNLLEEALGLFNDKKYPEALMAYDSIIDKDGENATAWYCKGVTHAYLDSNDAAIEAFENVNNIIPNHAPTMANLSALLEEVDSERASDYAKIALITYPDMDMLDRISQLSVEDDDVVSEVSDVGPLLISIPVEEDSIEDTAEDGLFDLLNDIREEETMEERARGLTQSGDYVGAVKLWKELLEDNSHSPRAWSGLADALELAGHVEKATQCRNRAESLENSDDGSIGVRDNIETKEREKVTEERLDLETKEVNEDRIYNDNLNISIEWYNKGTRFLEEGKSDEALSCFEKSIGGCPREEIELRVKSQNGRGQALQQMSKYSDSILAYHAAISLNPALLKGRTLYSMGQSYAFLELYEDALKCFEQSIGRGLDKDAIELCKTQIKRCKTLLREQNKRTSR